VLLSRNVSEEYKAQFASMSDRLGTVLFADVSGSTSLYETAGDSAALEAISACLGAAREATEASGGRVVKTIGDEVMSIFPGPDAAANAAADIQVRIDALPEVAGKKLGVRIGFHHGPVLQRQDDIFGDTVNLAARLVAQAKKGEIILSTDTAELLGPIFRTMVRELHAITVKGKAEEVGLAELIWKRDADATVFAGIQSRPRVARTALHLHYRGREVPRRRNSDSISIGRDNASGLVVHDEMASRQHCTIERRQELFVLRDHSTNGTYVTFEGDAEMALRRSEVSLRRHGWISFGQPRGPGVEAVEFFIDD
jgi:adenylate cyclase